MVVDDTKFVEKERIGLADLVCGDEVPVCKCHIIKMQVLHAKEELRQMGALEKTSCGAVGRDSLIVLAFCSKGVGKSNPSSTELRVHRGSFDEVASCFCGKGDAEVIDSDCEPGGWFLWVEVGKAVREKEKCVYLIKFVKTGKMKRVDGEIVFVRI